MRVDWCLRWAAAPPVVPCAMVIGDKEVVHQRRGLPKRVELLVDVHMHADVGGSSTPAAQIDAMLTAIEAALEPTPGQDTQTLGGLVSHCWIEGDIERFEMMPGNRCIVIVPVHILAP